MNLKAYLDAMLLQIAELEEELQGLTDLLAQRSLSRYEKRAAERCMQVLIEAAIGLGKHALKQNTKVAPSDAYACFEKLAELQIIKTKDLVTWKKVIGMRNALVHDYLNFNAEVLTALIEQQQYLPIIRFSRDVSKAIIAANE